RATPCHNLASPAEDEFARRAGLADSFEKRMRRLDQIGDQLPLDIRTADGRSNGLFSVCTLVTLVHQLSATGDADTASFDQLHTSAAHNTDLQQKSVAIGSGLVTEVKRVESMVASGERHGLKCQITRSRPSTSKCT